MDESQFANRSEERTVTFLRRNPRPATADAAVSVMISYADPVVAAGLAAVLGEHGGFQIVPAVEPGDLLSGPAPADGDTNDV